MVARRHHALLAVATATLCGLIAAAGAQAASYTVSTCGAGPNHAWVYGSNTSAAESGQTCPSNGSEYSGLWVRDVIPGASFGDGASGDWSISAPAGLSISAITYQRWIYKKDDQDLQPGLRVADGTLLESCDLPMSTFVCSVGTAGGGASTTFTGLSTPKLLFGVRCVTGDPGVNCSGGGTIHAARAAMYASQVTIADSGAPMVGAPSGPLFGGGWLRGTLTGGAPAGDASGVAGEQVLEGATSRGSLGLACDFTYVKPCADVASSPEVGVDTRTLADGPHTLAVAASDAAGNQGLSAARTVMVDNTAPSAPVGLSVGESSPSRSSTLSASWSLPPGQVSPIVGANWSLCVQGGSCTTGSVGGQSLQVAAPEGQLTLSVWLQDEAGNSDQQSAATAPLTVDRSAPGAPSGLTVSPGAASSAQRAVQVSWGPPTGTQVTPITSATWSVCHADGTGCVAGQTTGSSFGVDLGPGDYRVRVGLTDQAGNSDPAGATAERTFTVPGAPAPGGGGVAAKKSARLSLSRVLRGSKLKLTVRADSQIGGKVTVAASSRSGRRTVLSRHRTLTLHRGRAQVVITLPRAARRVVITARYAGSAVFRSGSATRSLTRR